MQLTCLYLHEHQINEFNTENTLRTRASCSKLTTSLVNVSLKFQTVVSEIRQYVLLKKSEAFALQKLLSFFSTKIFSVFGNKVVKHLTGWPLNELVKLTMLWTTGPRWILLPNLILIYILRAFNTWKTNFHKKYVSRIMHKFVALDSSLDNMWELITAENKWVSICEIPCFFGYIIQILPPPLPLPKQSQKSRSVLSDGSRSWWLFSKGKTCVIVKFHKTDLVICSHSKEWKSCLIDR